MNEVHYSSDKHDWETPDDFFADLHKEFGFDLDAAASADNAKCPNYITREQDSLSLPWTGTVWVNPPYGRAQIAFIRKAYEESLKGTTVVMLIPARPDTKVWHDVIFPYAEVRFIKGRLTFKGAPSAAPFPSAIVIFRPPQAKAA